jgi:hypothetical protein
LPINAILSEIIQRIHNQWPIDLIFISVLVELLKQVDKLLPVETEVELLRGEVGALMREVSRGQVQLLRKSQSIRCEIRGADHTPPVGAGENQTRSTGKEETAEPENRGGLTNADTTHVSLSQRPRLSKRF